MGEKMNKEMNKCISIVLPIFNEEDVIPALYTRITEAAKSWSYSYEILAVNDGSSDHSAELLRDVCQKDSRWKLICFSRNFGHQTAISCGIYYASGSAVVVMDADLQDPPEELHRFLKKWEEGYQVVYAVRRKRKENIFKRAAYAVFYRILKRVSTIQIPLDSGDFCVMDRCVADVLNSMPERARFVRGLRSWAGFRQIGVEYERAKRFAGDVKYTLPMLIKLAFDGMISFSAVPLRMASWLGICACFTSILIALVLGLWWISDKVMFGMRPGSVLGWTSLFCLILLSAGVQMLLLGVFGEYLARIFEESKQRQPWIIADAVGVNAKPDAGWFVSPKASAFIQSSR